MLSDTLRRFVFVQLNMHLVPHGLSDDHSNTVVQIDGGWEQSIIVATAQMSCYMEIQQVAEQARDVECAGVELMLEGVDVVDAAEEADEL
jgi:hypothetical protein